MANTPIVRFMLRSDLASVVAIEAASGVTDPLDTDGFLDMLRRSRCVGKVADLNGTVVGFTLYEARRTGIHLIKLAVRCEHTHCGIGSLMLANLTVKADRRGLPITVVVPERFFDGQCFLRRRKFLATEVLSRFFDDGDDAFVMEYQPEPLVSRIVAGQRIVSADLEFEEEKE